MASTSSPTVRSLYRRILRELPSRASPLSTSVQRTRSRHTILSHPSPLQHRIRKQISSAPEQEISPHRLQEAEQFVQYVRAQRMYATLIERYNPGMGMNEEERVRLTARRVGMDLPVDVKVEKK